MDEDPTLLSRRSEVAPTPRERPWYVPPAILCDKQGCDFYGKRPSAWICDYHPVRHVA